MEQVQDIDLDIILRNVVEMRAKLKVEELNAFLEITTMKNCLNISRTLGIIKPKPIVPILDRHLSSTIQGELIPLCTGLYC